MRIWVIGPSEPEAVAFVAPDLDHAFASARSRPLWASAALVCFGSCPA
jgi:hypothetical protein